MLDVNRKAGQLQAIRLCCFHITRQTAQACGKQHRQCDLVSKDFATMQRISFIYMQQGIQ